MSDQQDGGAALRAEALEFVEDPGLDGDVERGGGFVGDEELGVERGGDGDHDPLAHTAGEFTGEGFGDAPWVGQTHLGERVERELVGVVLGHLPVRGDDLLDLVADGEDRVEAGDGVLKDHRDLGAADLPEFVAVDQADILALEEDAAGGDGGGARQDAQDAEAERGLAGAALSDEGERFAALDAQRCVAQGADRPLRGCGIRRSGLRR